MADEARDYRRGSIAYLKATYTVATNHNTKTNLAMNHKRHSIQVYLTADQHEQLKAAAERLGVSLSKYLLMLALREQTKNPG